MRSARHDQHRRTALWPRLMVRCSQLIAIPAFAAPRSEQDVTVLRRLTLEDLMDVDACV
jgi:hypothetical protein